MRVVHSVLVHVETWFVDAVIMIACMQWYVVDGCHPDTSKHTNRVIVPRSECREQVGRDRSPANMPVISALPQTWRRR